MNEDVHLKLLIPCVAAGAIIGKGGEALEKIKRQTGARLKMSKANDFYPGTTERVCVIMGNIQACMQLNDYIMRKVSERPELIPSDGPPVSSHERHNQVKILVPNTTAGIIIGKSGSFIKQIKEQSGAVVQISQRSKELRLLERCIAITGDLEERRVAVSMILSKIAEDPHSASCPNCSYSHASVHSAFAPSQLLPPPPYTTGNTTVYKPVVNGGEVHPHACTNTTFSVDPYGIGSNVGKGHLPIYRDTSTLHSSTLAPVFFGFPPQDVTTLAPTMFSMLPPTAYPDFTQVVFNTPGRSVFHSSPLLNPSGNLGPPVSMPSFGLPSGLIPPTPMCRTKQIPGGSTPEGSGLFSWFPSVQATAVNSVRFSPMSAEPFADAANSVVLVNNRTMANALRLVPNYGLRCEAQQYAYSQSAVPESTMLQTAINSFPTVPNPERFNHHQTPSGPGMSISTSNITECGRLGDNMEQLVTPTTFEPEMTAHTRYCSGESTDSALTASLTSLRLHPSLDEHHSTENTHCSSPKSESLPTTQSTESINSNGTLSRLYRDFPGQSLNPDADFRMVEYSYMIPQNQFYGADRTLNTSIMPPFPGAVLINQPLSSSAKVSTNVASPGFHCDRMPCTAAAELSANSHLYGFIPNRPIDTQPSAGRLQFTYSNTPSTSLIHTPAITAFSQSQVFDVPQNKRSTTLVGLDQTDPSTGSGILLIGTLQQVQHALATLHLHTGPVIAPQSMTCTSETNGPPLSIFSSPYTTTTTLFTLDSPLRVDRIQPLSLPIGLQAFPSPLRSLTETVSSVR